MNRYKVILFLLVVSLVLTACSPANSPVGAAKQWMQALSKLDATTFTGLTCARMQEQSGQLDMWTALFQMLSAAGGQNANLLDIADVKFSETSNDNETAYVQVSGTLQINMGGQSQPQPIDETWRIVNEDGKWKWCGSGSQ